MIETENTLYCYVHYTDTGVAHLRVRQTFYHSDDFRDKIRRIGSPAIWYADKMEWDCPLTNASILVLEKVANEFKLEVQWSDELSTIAKNEIKEHQYEKKVRLAIERLLNNDSEIPKYLTNTYNNEKPPMRHQQVAYHWALRVRGLLLAWEPGLGKTRGAVDAAAGWYRYGLIDTMSNYKPGGEPFWIPQEAYYVPNEFDEHGNPKIKVVAPGRWGVRGGVLVVCPKAVMRTWSRELSRWQNMTAVEITGTLRTKYRRSGMVSHAHIINYESLKIVTHNTYDAIIVDESHRCARNSRQTNLVLSISLSCKKRLLLTGTPVSNNLESVFHQMRIVDGGRSLGVSHAAFVDEYFVQVQAGPGEKNIEKEGAIEKVASAMAQSCYFLKKEDALDLPEKTHSPVFLEMTNDQKRYYNKLRDEAITFVQDSQVTVEQAASRVMKLMQVCQGIVRDDEGTWKRFNSVKQDALLSDLQNELQDQKVIVWCRFTEEITMLLEKLHQSGIHALRFDGEVKHNDRNRVIDAWNNDPRYTVFVGQISMGEGVELVAENCTIPCYYTYYLGMDYRLVSWKQSQDRIHRITQHYNCYYKYLLTPNGIDHTIYRSVLSKEMVASEVHKTGKEYFVSLLTDDVPALEEVS